MRVRALVGALLLVGLFVPFFGCGSATGIDSIAVSPSSVSLAAGATAQLSATGTTSHGSHPASQSNVTNMATWTSSVTSVATVSATGVVTAVGAGTATITASLNGYGGIVTSNEVAVTVTGGTSGGTGSNLLTALSIIPNSQAVGYPGETAQFLAIGTTASGATEDLTTQVSWRSSSAQVATITTGGLATATGKGSTTITAIGSNPDGSVVTGTATFTVSNSNSEPYSAISVSPTAEALSATGQTGQLLAVATAGSSGLQQDVTNSAQVAWSSSIPTIATVTTYPQAGGTVAGVSPGSTTITAKLTNPDGSVLTSSATITVTASSAAEPLLSITVLPNTVTVGNLQGTAQFLAYGTFSTPPTVMDITNGFTHPGFAGPVQVTWVSGLQTYFPITTASGSSASGTETDGGLITAYASGNADVYAVAQNPDGTLVYSPSATFNCPFEAPTATSNGTCNPDTIADTLLVTVTVFNAGLNTTDWLVTAPSATGTPNVIHCGPGSVAAGLGAPVCSAPYPINTTVVLTAPSGTGQFGGWSYNCTPNPNPSTAAGPNTCTIIVGDDTAPVNPNSSVSIGAIFN